MKKVFICTHYNECPKSNDCFDVEIWNESGRQIHEGKNIFGFECMTYRKQIKMKWITYFEFQILTHGKSFLWTF